MAGMKTFWCVTTAVYDNGKVVSLITNMVEDVDKPENSFKSTREKDIYNDWFESGEEAEAFVKEAKKA